MSIEHGWIGSEDTGDDVVTCCVCECVLGDTDEVYAEYGDMLRDTYCRECWLNWGRC